jgi:hypothetical protein
MILIFTPRSFASYNASAISPVVKIKTATSIDFSEEFIVLIIVSLIRPLGEKRTSVFAYMVFEAKNEARILKLNVKRMVLKSTLFINPYLCIVYYIKIAIYRVYRPTL